MMKSLLNCPAPAKLNLFLHVNGRRADGYHLLQSVFQIIDRGDTLHFSLREDSELHRTNDIEGVPAEQDLVIRAARILQAEVLRRTNALPPNLQKKAIVWGTVGAIVVRSAMTVGVVWLLKIPGLMLIGGLGLLWIAYKLLADQGDKEHDGPVASTFWGAMKTIVVADALMGIDNVLGVAGAAHGSFDLVVIGLLVSIPIVVFGSTMVLKLVERFPIIINLGAAVLAFTAAKMIVSEQLLDPIYGGPGALPSAATMHTAAQWITYAVAVAGVLGAGWWATRRNRSTRDADLIPH